MPSSAKILSMKRSSRVSFVSQCKTPVSDWAGTGSSLGGAFISSSSAATWVDGTGYVVSPLDGVNGGRLNLASNRCRSVFPRSGGAWGGQPSPGGTARIGNPGTVLWPGRSAFRCRRSIERVRSLAHDAFRHDHRYEDRSSIMADIISGIRIPD